MVEDFFKLEYWGIRAASWIGEYSYESYLYNKFEKIDYMGVTTSGISKWELKQIKEWVKTKKPYIYISQKKGYSEIGYLNHSHIYYYPSCFDDEFYNLLKSFPKRQYMVKTRDINLQEHKQLVNEMERNKNNCHIITHEYSGRSLLYFTEKLDAMTFKLKWA